MPRLRALLALGTVSHSSILRMLELRQKDWPFGHNRIHDLPNGLKLVDSYHCSRYNTNTGRLTESMFHDVFESIISLVRA